MENMLKYDFMKYRNPVKTLKKKSFFITKSAMEPKNE
jgi:hypothetical protein